MGSVGGRRILAVLLVAALVAGPALGLHAPTDALDSVSAQDSGTAAAEGASTATLGPPDWPDEPLEPEQVPGRWVVQNTSEHPGSAIGHVGATGVVLSDYHVLTAAHVVTDDEGRLVDLDELVFTSGLHAPPDGPDEVPFGRAGVTDVHLHPEWAGSPPEDDLAVLVLDRPVGAHTGTMALDPTAVERAEDHQLRQAGYVNNVSGYRQVASQPRLQEARTAANPGYLHYCGPLSHGDSGSPIWTTVDGTPTVLAVNSDWDAPAGCDDAVVGVAMDRDRVDRVRSWMSRDGRPPALADLVVASSEAGPHWVEDADELPDAPVDANATNVSVGTRIYNNGPRSVGSAGPSPRAPELVSVEFTATVYRTVGGETVPVARDRPLCEARIAVEAYDATTARCEVDALPERARAGDVLTVSAHVDPDDRVPEYADTPVAGSDGPQPVGRIEVAEDA